MINKILEIARGELGYKEGANNNTKYGADYGLNYNPWCQMFIWWIAQKAGIGEDIIPKTASCPTAYRWFKSKGQVVPANQAKAGDIIFYQWNGSKNADHVGIVESVQNGIITVIEGNKNNAVERRQVNVNNTCIFAVCRPKYIEITQENNANMQSGIIYVVQQGDTLSKIANRYNTKWEQIYADNKEIIGGNPDIIQPGQILKINATVNTTTSKVITYKVNANSGLWLLDGNGKKVKAYVKGTEVEYLGVGYTKYGYNYVKVKPLVDGKVGYMAKKYLI